MDSTEAHSGAGGALVSLSAVAKLLASSTPLMASSAVPQVHSLDLGKPSWGGELGLWCQGPYFLSLPAYLLCELGKSLPFSEAHLSHLGRGDMTTPHSGGGKLPSPAFRAAAVTLPFCWGRSPPRRKRPRSYQLF